MQLMKGTLDVLILKTLSNGALHGYAISRWIRETSDDVLAVEEGALYPALRRLENKGLLESRWGATDTGRQAKFYELTGKGRVALEAELESWDRYAEAMGRVLEGSGPG